MIGKWIEIFKAGDYGEKGSYTEAVLDGIVANFDATDKAPIVVGHPKTDSPAWGWIDALKREGDRLFARVGEMRAELVAAIADGRFKNRSVKLVSSGGNGPRLAHLGFLGGVLPEVTGLAPLPEFAAADGVEFEAALSPDRGEADDALRMQLSDEITRRINAEAELANLKALARKQEFEAWVDEQANQGRIPQSLKDAVTSLLISLPASGEVSFSMDDKPLKATPVELMKTIISTLPAPSFSMELPLVHDKNVNGLPAQPVDLTKYL